MRTDLFDFELPETLIALHPARPRDSARMLVVQPGEPLSDRGVTDLVDLLRPGDALVFNDTRVIPAQLSGTRLRDGNVANIETTLIERVDECRWNAYARPGKRLKPGDMIRFGEEGTVCYRDVLNAVVEDKSEEGTVTLRFNLHSAFLDEAISQHGRMPLPPYIAGRRDVDDGDAADYQTIYAEKEGAVAAPTAGLHFTPELFARLDAAGIQRHFVTLHVGAGTFLPVKAQDTQDHVMHVESGEVTQTTADALNAVRAAGGRIVAVGSTSLRLLESAADEDWTDHAVLRQHRNFHYTWLQLPRSRRSDDEFPSAEVNSIHARFSIQRTGNNVGCICARNCARLPLLFLWRCKPTIPRRNRKCRYLDCIYVSRKHERNRVFCLERVFHAKLFHTSAKHAPACHSKAEAHDRPFDDLRII